MKCVKYRSSARWIDIAMLVDVTGSWKRNLVRCAVTVGETTTASQAISHPSPRFADGDTVDVSLDPDSGLGIEVFVIFFCRFGADGSGGDSEVGP